MEHPDKIFGLPNVDQEEQSTVQDTHRESFREEELPPIKKDDEEKNPDSEGENENEEDVEYDDDGNVIPKPKPEPVVIKKDKSNRISSDKD